MKRVPHDTAKTVADFLLRQRFATERQEEFWREQAAARVESAKRPELMAVAEALGLPDRPPADWKSPRERHIEALEEEAEEMRRDAEDARRRLAEAKGEP